MIIESQLQVTDAVIHELRRAKSPRLKEIMTSLIAHLHAFAREVKLTEKELNEGINIVARLGQLTTESHNEVRLMAGTLGLSMLVCLLDNGGGGETDPIETSANLLGPFWREGSPITPNGGSIVRSDTPGVPLFVKGYVKDSKGTPVADAEVDVWHASPVGLYENQDPEQAEMNLRGRLRTDTDGVFAFRSVKPAGYPLPMGGPVGELITALERHPFRPAHIHALIHKEGFKTIASQLYSHDDPKLDSDAQFGVTRALVVTYVEHHNEPAPDPDVKGKWFSFEHTFVLEPGEAWRPTPPVSKKAEHAPAYAAAAKATA
jgi:protocatechuate 3,4-dioxygenase beta subunit